MAALRIRNIGYPLKSWTPSMQRLSATSRSRELSPSGRNGSNADSSSDAECPVLQVAVHASTGWSGFVRDAAQSNVELRQGHRRRWPPSPVGFGTAKVTLKVM